MAKRKSIEEMSDEEFERLLDDVAGPRSDKVQKPDPRFTETEYGPTPSGGAYSVAYYYDKDGNPCKKADAVRLNIIEYSAEGKRINEVYGILG